MEKSRPKLQRPPSLSVPPGAGPARRHPPRLQRRDSSSPYLLRSSLAAAHPPELSDKQPEGSGLTAALENTNLSWDTTPPARGAKAARTPGIRVVHRTNLWADVLRSQFDEETDSNVLWTQVVPAGTALNVYANTYSRPGFTGRRSVAVKPEHLTSESGGLWSLFRLGHEVVANPSSKEKGGLLDHRIWNFVLVPQGVETRRGARRGWTLEGEVRPRQVLSDLPRLLSDYFEDERYREHVHLALQLAALHT